MKKFFIAFSLVFLVSCGSSTTIVSSWKDPESNSTKEEFKKKKKKLAREEIAEVIEAAIEEIAAERGDAGGEPRGGGKQGGGRQEQEPPAAAQQNFVALKTLTCNSNPLTALPNFRIIFRYGLGMVQDLPAESHWALFPAQQLVTKKYGTGPSVLGMMRMDSPSSSWKTSLNLRSILR